MSMLPPPEVVDDSNREAWKSLAEANRQLTKFALENAELKVQLAEMAEQYRKAVKMVEQTLKALRTAGCEVHHDH